MKMVESLKWNLHWPAVVLALLGLWPAAIHAQVPPGGTNGPSYTPLDSWSFTDPTNWTSDNGYTPLSFTNLGFSHLGDEASLVVDSTNAAWLQYNVIETNGATNLTVDAGTVAFWFAPNWSSTNAGGLGPGDYGRLLEVGAYTADSSLGWWSLYVDDGGNHLYFSAQTNDYSSGLITYLSVPISWTTNYFHYLVLTYCATNTALYLDGGLVTNGPPLTVYPGPDVLSNGFFVGSDSNGVSQAHGLFNSVYTYNVPLDAGTIQTVFNHNYTWYMMNPLNSRYMSPVSSASSSPSFSQDSYNAISGQGSLQLVSAAPECWDGTNADQIWLTNVTATAAGDGKMDVTFTIEGGTNDVLYDIFANSVLSFGTNAVPWAWMGAGYHCKIYELTNMPALACFLISGTPEDSDADGLTDAYELLVSKTDPTTAQWDSYGIPYAWYMQYGLDPAEAAAQDPDQDALLNYQEYLYGTRPQVSEGFAVWVSTPNGSSSIP